MRKRKIDPDMPSGRWVEVPDFLPPPEEIAKAKTIMITMNLDQETVDFFKKVAKKKGGKYQQMIRKVLARYAEHFSKSAA